MEIFDFINKNTKDNTIIEVLYIKDHPYAILSSYGSYYEVDQMCYLFDKYPLEYKNYFNKGDGIYYLEISCDLDIDFSPSADPLYIYYISEILGYKKIDPDLTKFEGNQNDQISKNL